MESKIRIINNALRNANLSILDGKIVSFYNDENLGVACWCKILRAMQEIEIIFAIPPIVLTQYIHQESLILERLYESINPYNDTWDYLPLQIYLTELDKLIVLSKGKTTTTYVQNSMRLELRLKVYRDLLSNQLKQF